MKIQYCSDLHLEFPENLQAVTDKPLAVVGDILVLAGDIVPLSSLTKYNWFFDWVADNFKMTYWIPGNHEYYGSSIEGGNLLVHEKIRSNIILINNRSVEIEDFVIHFSTLWSHISLKSAKAVQHGISDFFQIRYNGKVLEVDDFNLMHESSKMFLSKAFNSYKGRKTVVVTHHVPTLINYPKEFYGDALNEAFACELSESIKEWEPRFWIYGHHHRNVDAFRIGNTKLLTNQLGYVHMADAIGFEPNRVVEMN